MHSYRKPFRLSFSAAAATATATAALLACAAPAMADDAAARPADQSMFGTQTDVVVGISAGLSPRYMGASGTRLQVLPTLNIHRGIFFADSIRGIGAEYQSASGFYIGQAFNYDFGRTDSNSYLRPGSNRLRGMGDVKGAVTSATTVAQQLLPWLSVNAMAELGLDGHKRGNQYQFGLESVVASASKQDTLTTDLGAKLGDRQYNQSYFGVTQTQSANSGFGAYAPGSGIYAYFLTAGWDHVFDKHWASQLVLGGTWYTDKAGNSPIVDRRLAPLVYSALNYTF
ncbi:MipA/OmpV family protein [Oxalobacteraceae bacterium CAVE-383]|nr:MipA/OmpV family protein [Oxalobacteraceae bacterium CAVE-383]